MADERIQQAKTLREGSKAYAKAFLISAHICRVRYPDGNEVAERLAGIFEEKARLEVDLCQRLDEDPIGTLIAEGLA